MEGKARTAWYTFIVIFGSAILLLGGFAVISYEERLATAASATEADSVELFDHDRRLHNSIKALSHCATSCVFNQITDHGCAYSDYVCMCQKFQVLGDPCLATNDTQVEFKSCMEECTLHDQWHSPGIIINICHAVDVRVVLPEFMLQHFRIHGRQFSGTYEYPETYFDDYSTSDYYGLSTTTKTLTVPSGFPETTYTETTGSSVTVYVEETGLSSSSSSGSDGSRGSSRKSSGLSSGARIGIGVVIPLVAILLAASAGWFWRRRKRNHPVVPDAAGEAEKNKNPPGIAELGDRPHFPPAYHPPDANTYKNNSIEPEIQVLGQDTSYAGTPGSTVAAAHEPNNDPSMTRHELTAVSTRRSELPESPPQAYSPNIGRKPLSPTATQSKSPPPWETSQRDSEYIPYRSPDSVPSQSEVVSTQGPSSATGDDEIRQLEEEMARIKAQKERLQALQTLEAREEELRRAIEAKKGGGSGT